MQGIGSQPFDGADVYDGRIGTAVHERYEVLGHQERASEVHGHGEVPVGHRLVGQRPGVHDPRVVDQYIDATVSSSHGLSEFQN